MNVVILVGNLATDPELTSTPNGKPVCKFRLAVSRTDGESADFVTVVAWERQAQICADYLRTGRRIAVQGRIHHSTWKVDDKPRSSIEVIAHRVELLSPAAKTPREATSDSSSDTAPATSNETAVDAPEFALA